MRILILFLSFLLVSSFAYAEDEEGAEPITEYLELMPKFTVNLDKPKKYLAVNVQLLLEGDEFIEKVKNNLPPLRHELIMLFSGRSTVGLQTMEQRELLRKEAKEALAKVMEKMLKGNEGLKDVFFTEFLVN